MNLEEELTQAACLHGFADKATLDALDALGYRAEEALSDASKMAETALEVKRARGAVTCILPLNETVEAEAFGAEVKLGEPGELPRPGSPVLSALDQCLENEMNVHAPQMAAVLGAIETLAGRGESVCLNIASPMTVVNALADVSRAFKALRRDPDLLERVLWHFADGILAYAREAVARGVVQLRYSDPICAPDILGPRQSDRMVGLFTERFVQRLLEVAGDAAQVILCPLATRALVHAGAVEAHGLAVPEGVSYEEACLLNRAEAPLVGQLCPHMALQPLSSGRLWAFDLRARGAEAA